jgi:hypothetical protein
MKLGYRLRPAALLALLTSLALYQPRRQISRARLLSPGMRR